MSRERGLTRYISVTGIDGSGKSSVANGMTRIFGSEIPVASIGSMGVPSYLIHPQDGTTILYPSLSRACRRMYDRGQEEDRALLVLFANVMHSLASYRFAEPKAAQMGARLVVRDRDPYVDTLAMLANYDMSKIPLEVLLPAIRILSHPNITDLLLYLDTPVDVAGKRLGERSFHDRHEERSKLEKASVLYPDAMRRVRRKGYIQHLFAIKNDGGESLDEVTERAVTRTRQQFPNTFTEQGSV